MRTRSTRRNRRWLQSKSKQSRHRSTPGLRQLGMELLEDRRLLSLSQPAVELFDASPPLFVENQGQWADASIRYALHGSGANVLHTTGGPVFQLFKYGPAEETDETVDLYDPMDPLAEPAEVITQYVELSVSFDGANIVEPVGMDQAEAVHNFFIGDEANWRVGVPSYETVGYSGLYDGIDLLTWGKPDSLKYEFHVAPGSDYTQIEITYHGTTGLQLDANGVLHVQTSLGELVDDAPKIYQEIDGEQVEVAGAFNVIDPDTYSFTITGDYDSSAELIIDPEVDWSTYIGGGGDDRGHDITVDLSGNAFIAGKVRSADLSGAINSPSGGGGDAFVAKLAPNGNLEWSTYLGGSSYDQANGITLDGTGNVVVSGRTWSDNLPAATNERNGYWGDAFAGKLTDNGHLLWTAYVGGTHEDVASGVATDSEGNVLVGGTTRSSNFDRKINEPFGANDGFLAKLTAQGTVEWARYLGGPGEDSVYDVAIRGETDVLVAGLACQGLEGAINVYKGGVLDAFVARISAADGSQIWATYLGGTDNDSAYGIAVDSYGDALIVGNTRSADFEGASNAHHSVHGTLDAFVAKVSANGVQTWATFVGGRYHDEGHGIALDAYGNALVTGITSSYDFEGVVHPDSGMGTYAAKILADGSMDQAVLFGGSRRDDGYGIAVDQSGNVLITGYTDSEHLEAVNNEYYGGGDAFVAKISGLGDAAPVTLSGTKFEDLNNNGARDAGEPGLEGWTIQLEQFASELLTTFDNPEPATNDFFGVRLAQYGDDILISAPNDDSIGGADAGAVYMFSTSGEQLPFPLPELRPGDHFGYSIATSGAKVLVGAYDDREAWDSGSVWLFDGSIWRRIPNPTPCANDNFGSSVGWMGRNIVVGAGYDNGNTGTVYMFDGITLELLDFEVPSLPAGSEFGLSLAVHDDKMVVSARWDSTDAHGGGAVWLYDDAVADPQQKWRKIPNPDPHAYDFFGYGIAWLGDKFVAGCHRGPDWHSADPGSVYVFDASGNVLHTIDGSAPGDGFGYAVLAAGNNILIGAPNDDTGGGDAGIAYLYDGSTYERLLTVSNPTPASNDRFGCSLAGVGNDVLITARQANVGPGIAYLFSTTNLAAAQTTLAEGSYEFGDVTPGKYRVSEVLHDGWTQTYPDGDGAHMVIVGTDDISELNFGNWINYPPAANDDGEPYTTDEDTPLTVNAPGVLANDTDANGDDLTAEWVSGPSHGVLDLYEDGSFEYTPDPNYNGPDSFTYKAHDGIEPSNEATVSITVEPVNDAPVIDADYAAVATNEGQSAANSGTFSDVDQGDSVTITASIGTITQVGTQSGTWSWSFDSTDGPDESQMVEIIASDGNGPPTPTTFALTVNNVAPRLDDATFAIPENTPNGTLVGTVTGTDPGEDTLTYCIIGGTGATAFAIDTSTGEITVVDALQLDYETTPSFTLEVQVVDGDPDGIGTATVMINLLNQASITGAVFVDVNENRLYDANEPGIDGVVVELLDKDDNPILDELGDPVTRTTSDGGFYLFDDLDPCTYQLYEIQPTGVDDGAEIVGNLGGTIPANDTMQLTLDRIDAADYMFAELGQDVTSGDTATIGFWQNKHGQNLIASGGPEVAAWLTDNFANVFGDTFTDNSGSNDGAEVAAFFKDQLFRQKSTKPIGPAKVDAQFMAVVLASYFTSSDLAGNVAADFGFNVTDTGIGTKIVNVADNGAAFDVDDGIDLTIIQLLMATNALTDHLSNELSGFAHIYDQDGDGEIDSAEALLRMLANDVYSAINEQGAI